VPYLWRPGYQVDGNVSSTPKPVRRNGGYCTCEITQKGDAGTCRYGCCTEFRCLKCHGKTGGWGPVGCKCEGGPRWARHPGMAQRVRWYDKDGERYFAYVHAAVKPSIARRRKLGGTVKIPYAIGIGPVQRTGNRPSADGSWPSADGRGCPRCGAIRGGSHGADCPNAGTRFDETGKLIWSASWKGDHDDDN
jgi:hypothetical protein